MAGDTRRSCFVPLGAQGAPDLAGGIRAGVSGGERVINLAGLTLVSPSG